MDDDLLKMRFLTQEMAVIEKIRDKYPAEAFVPLLFTIREANSSWSYFGKDYSSIAIKHKEIDLTKKPGVTMEYVRFFINPIQKDIALEVIRLEKCSEENVRRLAKRPASVYVDAEYALLAKIDPVAQIISIKPLKLPVILKGTSAANFNHEFDHISKKPIKKGKTIWNFQFETIK
ncbi:MAG: hypothetical protein ACFFC7_16820 [Candidatus Hermodarchaeota archaeon]